MHAQKRVGFTQGQDATSRRGYTPFPAHLCTPAAPFISVCVGQTLCVTGANTERLSHKVKGRRMSHRDKRLQKKTHFVSSKSFQLRVKEASPLVTN